MTTVFARAEVPSYWMADIRYGCIVEHRDPCVAAGRGVDQIVQSHPMRDTIPLVLDGHELARLQVVSLLMP